MERSLQEDFISKLEEKYGEWHKSTSQFGTTPFGVISQDLSISPSQFSKLIYGTATEGMYERSIENINRLIQRSSLLKQLEASEKEKEEILNSLTREKLRSDKLKRLGLFGGFFLLTASLLAIYLINSTLQANTEEPSLTKHPLSPFFDRTFNANFSSPFLDISEVQEFAPASAYEGVWSLNKPYKLPLPGSKRPGLYYLGKSADMRLKVSRYDTARVGKGRVLHGYEFLINEIWVDTEMTPLSPKYFDTDSKSFTQEFSELNFEENPQFKKVATLYSFFTDKFELYKDSIVRIGEPCGRFAKDVDEELAANYEIDIKYNLEHVLGDLTTTDCNAMQNLFCNPNDLIEGKSILNFQCLYTIKNENLGIGGGYPYQKGFRLIKQNYTDNLVFDCN